MRVALFITCYNDLLFPEVGRAMVSLIRRLGHEVEFPAEQTCCGQMHFNSGYQDACIPLVDRFSRAFESYDIVVTPSGSCAAMVRHHHPLVASLASHGGADGGLSDRVATVAPRVFELSEFLVDVLGVTDVGARFPHTVAFHPTCHSTRLLGVGDRPTRLLAEVEGLTPWTCRGPKPAAGSVARSRSRTQTRPSRWDSTRSTTCSRPAPRC